MKRFFFVLAMSSAVSEAQPFLMQSPQKISLEQVEKLPRKWHAGFYGKECHAIFLYHEGMVGAHIATEKDVLFETSSWDVIDRAVHGEPQKEGQSYLLGKVRCLEGESNVPQKMTVEQAADFIASKKVVFYTGAGISRASGVPTMDGLLEILGLSKDLQLSLSYAEQVKNNPEKILKGFAGFCEKAFTAEPTLAHKAIAALSLAKKMQVMTENFDFLHHRSGIKPFEVSSGAIRAYVKPEEIASIDALICVGMSADDRGFLQWYKDTNPHGRIIAFNLEVPKYVGNEDYVVLGDVQESLPVVRERMQAQVPEITLVQNMPAE